MYVKHGSKNRNWGTYKATCNIQAIFDQNKRIDGFLFSVYPLYYGFVEHLVVEEHLWEIKTDSSKSDLTPFSTFTFPYEAYL